jgi:molybdopterin molybdotransferase
LVTARLFLAPLIRGMSGGDAGVAVCWRRALLASPIEACGDRETFVRGSWEGDAVVQVSNQDSSAQRALADAELLIRRRAGASPLAAGESVEIIDF